MKYVFALALCLSLAMLPALGSEGFPKTIVDSANRTVTINEPVEKIVPIITWAYEPILILGLKDAIVGVTSDTISVYGNMTEGIDDRSVGTYREPDYEKIIQLHPDLVIIGRNAGTNAEEKLAPAGIPVVWLNFNDPTTFDKEFEILASLTKTEEKANSFLSWKKEKLDAIENRISKVESRTRVYPTWCDYPLLSASNGSGIQEEINMAGGINIASGLAKTYPGVDAEWVLEENPEAVIVGSTGCKAATTGYSVNNSDEAKKLIDVTSEAAGLNQTEAAKNGKIFVLDGRCEEAVRGFVGVYYLAKWLYPEQFKDLDPEAIHKEYFENWLEVPYKGIWAYPPAS
jgi:iron complex transport system substrate-binding protein